MALDGKSLQEYPVNDLVPEDSTLGPTLFLQDCNIIVRLLTLPKIPRQRGMRKLLKGSGYSKNEGDSVVTKGCC